MQRPFREWARRQLMTVTTVQEHHAHGDRAGLPAEYPRAAQAWDGSCLVWTLHALQRGSRV